MAFCLPTRVYRRQRAPQVGLGVGVFRAQPDRGAKLFDRRGKILVPRQCQPQIVMHIEIVWARLHRCGKLFDRRGKLSHRQQRPAQRVFHRGVTGTQALCLRKLCRGIPRLAAHLQHRAKIVLSLQSRLHCFT